MLSRRATSNHKVKETVALELSYVNSNLQLLKEELEELNSCMDVYQNERWVLRALVAGEQETGEGWGMGQIGQKQFFNMGTSTFHPPNSRAFPKRSLKEVFGYLRCVLWMQMSQKQEK